MISPPAPFSRQGKKSRTYRIGSALEGIVFVGLLAVMASRLFICELPFRLPLLSAPGASSISAGSELAIPDRGELARVSFAMILLGLACLHMLASWCRGRIVIRQRLLTVLVAVFVAMSAASAFTAADKRSAWDVWVEQTSLLVAMLVAVEVFTDRRRLVWLAVVLAAAGGVIAVKAFWQMGVEIPDRVADFEANRAQRLVTVGLADGSAEAAIFEARLRATTPTGFFVMSNLLASALVVTLMAAAGLAADKISHAARSWRETRGRMRRGEIPTPILAAAISVVLALAIAVALAATRSRGGIAVGAAAIIGWLALLRWRQGLAKHWRRTVIVGACLLAMAVAGVVAYGLKYDRLPSRSMTFRWYYWTGATEIVRQHPWLGVGGGNFPSAYLQVRRAAAEEAVKLPHNIIAHALSQFGLPGGMCYLAILAVAMVGLCRPRDDADGAARLGAISPPRSNRNWAIVLAMLLSVMAARVFWASALTERFFFLFEGLAPTCLLAIFLAVAMWAGGRLGDTLDLSPSTCRVALACGTGGFLLHSMIEFGPWVPGTALLFWVVCGALLARDGGKYWQVSHWRKPVAGASVLTVTVIGMMMLLPVWHRTILSERASAALAAHDAEKAVALVSDAATADPLDSISAADAARVMIATAPRDAAGRDAAARSALAWADLAAQRDGSYYGHPRLAAEIAATLVLQNGMAAKALEYQARAMRLNPMDARLRIEYAGRLIDSGRGDEGLAQLAETERINAQLTPDSQLRLREGERKQVEAMRSRAE